MRILCVSFTHFTFSCVSFSFSSHVLISVHRRLVLSLSLLLADTIRHATITRVAQEAMLRFLGGTLAVE
jgi:hypothetical protein